MNHLYSSKGYFNAAALWEGKDINEAWVVGVVTVGDWPEEPWPAAEKAQEDAPQENEAGWAPFHVPGSEALVPNQDLEGAPEEIPAGIQDLTGEGPTTASVGAPCPPKNRPPTQ